LIKLPPLSAEADFIFAVMISDVSRALTSIRHGQKVSICWVYRTIPLLMALACMYGNAEYFDDSVRQATSPGLSRAFVLTGKPGASFSDAFSGYVRRIAKTPELRPTFSELRAMHSLRTQAVLLLIQERDWVHLLKGLWRGIAVRSASIHSSFSIYYCAQQKTWMWLNATCWHVLN